MKTLFYVLLVLGILKLFVMAIQFGLTPIGIYADMISRL